MNFVVEWLSSMLNIYFVKTNPFQKCLSCGVALQYYCTNIIQEKFYQFDNSEKMQFITIILIQFDSQID